MFKPWIDEKVDLKFNFSTYCHSFKYSVNNNQINDLLCTEFIEQKNKTQFAIDKANELIYLADADVDLVE